MAAKLLHSLADDNPDLQKQIGCMSGILQLFDRHHILTARQINQKRLPPANRPSGNSHFANGILEKDSSSARQQQITSDVSPNKGFGEKQRISTESSRVSFSSSCSSSLSSLDCRAQMEGSFDRIIYPETPSREPVMNQTTVSPHLGMQSLDLRDVVKDSMYREARGLPMKKATAEEEAVFHAVKHRDSPRPLHLSKSADGSCGVGIDGKQSVPVDVKESLRVLAKLREAPWYYGEAREIPRSSSEVKDGHWHLISRDAPRFSYDGREISRLSFESRDTIKGPPKLKELPRLSLDSREGSWCTYSADSKPNLLSRSLGSGNSTSDDKMGSLPQSTQRRPPSVVAKLMGLEALPDSYMAADTPLNLGGNFSAQHDTQFPKSSKNGLIKPLKVFNSPRSSLKDPTSPRRKNPDLVMKPISSSRFPIEPAPWKQQDGNQSSQKSSLKAMKAPTRTPDSFPSVYSEIEKRLKDLEFKQSGRDLRALKQILEAMQAKGLLETREEEQAVDDESQRDNGTNTVSLSQNSRSVRQQSPHSNNFLSSSRRVADSRACESPIVVMKPARLVDKTGISASSVIPVGGLSSFHKLDSVANEDKKRISASSRISKDHSPKNNRRDTTASSNDRKNGSVNTIKSAQSQSRSQQISKENSLSSIKNSGSVSPRMQQKKLEFERRSCPQTPPSDSNKARRKYSKQATDSGSPGGKLRPKSPCLQQSDNPLSLIRNETRTSSCQKDEIFVESDSITVSDSNMDMEVSSSLQSPQTNDSRCPSMKTVKQPISGSTQKKSIPRLHEDESVADIAINSQEHPSPVSVLDGSVYRDDEPSPVRQIADTPKADDAQECEGNENEDWWNPADKLVYSAGSGEINRKKLQSIDHLVQKLRRVNSSHDESRNDYIASLCENTNADQRYISEILLASGLLLRDLSSELLTFQLHPSGHPINPELFFVLEQTKASSFIPKEECGPGKVACSKLNAEKFHRKLIFDAVNEILGVKLALVSSSPEPWVKPSRLTKKSLGAQKLLKELCFEIEKIQFKKPESSQEHEDGLGRILSEDVMHGSESWIDFHGEISGVVLDAERLIFKDLIDEIVIGEAAGLRIKSGRRRNLFGM
ncbi:protein LONGIFOLIA 1 isoform X2 [Neltuma alba]|uniref:protein LONGIFOLIA 1 isoform X2 n=2 Tax=Neltuma alba TaxID=207710 RepID=UPI0010A46253|nr:protein LONGIFOLIA 1-like isoform X2 [Prosopis alba]